MVREISKEISIVYFSRFAILSYFLVRVDISIWTW
jgi:hypothetical protein